MSGARLLMTGYGLMWVGIVLMQAGALVRRFGVEALWRSLAGLGAVALVAVLVLVFRAVARRHRAAVEARTIALTARCQRVSGESVKEWRERAAQSASSSNGWIG